jgi:hypothetical protein
LANREEFKVQALADVRPNVPCQVSGKCISMAIRVFRTFQQIMVGTAAVIAKVFDDLSPLDNLVFAHRAR